MRRIHKWNRLGILLMSMVFSVLVICSGACGMEPSSTETEAEVKVETEAKAETEVETRAETEAETRSETEAETKAETEAETEAKQDIVILATSDVHCGIEENFAYAGLEQIREVFEKSGVHTILVDGGDFAQGEAIGTITEGDAIIGLMNELAYDVAIPGNHDYDYGMDQFFTLTGEADFPFISCNFEKEGELVFDPYLIMDADGTKIGFVGVTTPETITTSTPTNFQDEDGNFIYGFLQEDRTGQELYDAVQAAVDEVLEEGADYVFLLSHLGESASSEPWTSADVISHTSGIDVVLDGHSHDTDQVVVEDMEGNEVPRMGLGTKLNGIGYVRISADDGSISHEFYTWTNTPSFPYLADIGNDLSASVNKALEELKEELDKAVAYSPFDLVINDPEEVDRNGVSVRIVRKEETNLGDLIADALRYASGADVAIYNGGAVRTGFSAGDITYLDLMNLMPFSDAMDVLEVTGQQILDALEWGARFCPDECGGFLHVAGITYEIHTDIESSCTSDENGMFAGVEGEYRVQNVMIGGEALDTGKTYSLASVDYMLAEHGDGFTMFDDSEVLQKASLLDVQVMINYLTGPLGGTVPEEYSDPYGQGRITILS